MSEQDANLPEYVLIFDKRMVYEYVSVAYNGETQRTPIRSQAKRKSSFLQDLFLTLKTFKEGTMKTKTVKFTFLGIEPKAYQTL